MQGDQVKISLTAPPVEGAANKALCRMIAKELGVAKGRVSVIVGEKSRDKLLRIQGVDPEVVRIFCLDNQMTGQKQTLESDL